MKLPGFHYSYITFLLLLTCCYAGGQEPEQSLSLQEVVALAQGQSIAARQAETTRQSRYWEWRTFQADLRPQLLLRGNLPDFQRSYSEVIQPDGTVDFQPIKINNSGLSLGLQQRIAATGGTVFANTLIQRFDDFDRERTIYNGRPFSIGIEQPLFGFNQLRWDKKIEPLRYQESRQQYLLDHELIAVYNEMIDHLREERTRQQQQHFFLDKLIQTSPVGIVILDYDNHIVDVNPRAREMLQLNAEINPAGLPLSGVDHPVTRAAAELPTGATRSVSIQGTETYKISKAHFIDRGFARPFLMVEELTADILRAEKETYGKVIRMMAHEVNNSIGAVNSLLQAVTSYEEMLPDAEAADFRAALDVCIERNDRLNRFMRNFADVVRLPAPTHEACDLRRLLSDLAGLMQESAAERDIRLLTELPPEAVTVSLDIQQMELVLLNAIKNALESIGRDGTVELRLLSDPRRLIIRDNGRGIDPAMAEKVFSLFFTTKREGQGIGLTLSREILLNHGFGFSLKTGEDGWTEFVISFQL